MTNLQLIQFVTLNILLVVLLVMANKDFCGSVFETQVDHALIGNNLENASVVDELECQLKCLSNTSCKSFNVHPGGDKRKVLCELNNKTRQMKPGDFKWKKGSTYYASVKVSCMESYNIQNDAHNSGHCHPGYKGEWCQIAIKGWYAEHPGHSCKHILDSGDSKGDGEYWIDPEKSGNPFKAYCDMTTDSGGWLLVANFVITNPENPHGWTAETSYRGISNYHSNLMGITRSAMHELRSHLPFTQLRFHCKKQQGRTFHVTTVANSTGEDVVQYFSGQTEVLPSACNSFVRMEDDNSFLAQQCSQWGNDGSKYAGKWGHISKQGDRRIYNHAAFVATHYHWMITDGAWKCDDGFIPLSEGDFWKIYLR